ncbi:hypothetical protein J7L02_01680 [Candidatus Woesearchaeota archaeon]|nr:hypothetical protein [Candidatus Woesearchaeota archaeon]
MVAKFLIKLLGASGNGDSFNKTKLVINLALSIIAIIVVVLIYVKVTSGPSSVSAKSNGVLLSVEPSSIDVNEAELSSLVTVTVKVLNAKKLLKALQSNSSNESVALVTLMLNASNKDYLKIIDVLTKQEVEMFNENLALEDNALIVKQFYVKGFKVPGQEQSPWSLTISLESSSSKVLASTSVEVVVK